MDGWIEPSLSIPLPLPDQLGVFCSVLLGHALLVYVSGFFFFFCFSFCGRGGGGGVVRFFLVIITHNNSKNIDLTHLYGYLYGYFYHSLAETLGFGSLSYVVLTCTTYNVQHVFRYQYTYFRLSFPQPYIQSPPSLPAESLA